MYTSCLFKIVYVIGKLECTVLVQAGSKVKAQEKVIAYELGQNITIVSSKLLSSGEIVLLSSKLIKPNRIVLSSTTGIDSPHDSDNDKE